MRKLHLTFPEILFIGVTHLVFGAGLALLGAGKLGRRSRKRLGAALTAAGIATGVPRVRVLLRGRERSPEFGGKLVSGIKGLFD
jgi:hypothetical protein